MSIKIPDENQNKGIGLYISEVQTSRVTQAFNDKNENCRNR